jgi:hypothetical protein
MKEYIDASGRLSIDLDNDDRRFMLYASRLKDKIKARLIQKLESPDQRYWDYDFDGVTVVLHCDVFAGISLHVKDGSHDEILRDLADQLSKD